ncbi:MAG: class I SAM-dependent methyltransferase [Acidimicrobiales bacterium]
MKEPAALGSDQEFYEEKAALYREAENPVLLAQVLACLPAGGRVLDVGCGSGGLLRRLGERASYRAGVELSASASAAAARVADEVVNLPVTAPLPFPPASFDVVVCADVLEHLPEPATALSSVVRLCRPGGAVVISVPNIAYWQARLRLLRGVWRYEPTGLFDSGHLRFLTRETLLELVAGCGLAVETMEPARVPGLGAHVLARVPRPLRKAVDRAWGATENLLARRRPTLFAYQLVCTARRPPADRP